MPGLRPLHAMLLVPLLGGGRHASDLAETLGVSRQAVAQVVTRLESRGFTVLTHSRVPCNDGGISLGQAVIAAARDRLGSGAPAADP